MTTGYQLGMKYMEIPPDICTNICGASDSLEPNVFHYFLDNLMKRKLSDGEVISDLRGLIERQIIFRRHQLPAFGAEGFAQKPEVLDEYIQSIDKYRPYVLKALPVYLYLLALHILERKLKPPQIRGGLMPMGFSMTPYMKSVIESAFECRVHEDYGSAELGGMASECGEQNGLHPFAGFFYIEVVRDGYPVEDGEVGRVLITDLYNYAMPLIRYDIGDVAVRRKSPCQCGLPGERLEIRGRLQDCLVGADGEVLTHDEIVDSILECSDVMGFQLEYRDKGKLDLQVVPRNSHSPTLQEVCQSLSRLLGGNPKISARIVPTITPEPGGKYRFVKNLSKNAEEIL